jgi:hypothetical protein
VPARATLLLYTDGLVERRGSALDNGIARASAFVHEGRDSALDDLANQMMSHLAPGGGYQDDVVLLLYRHPAPLEMNLPANVSQLAPSRAALRSRRTRARVEPDQAQDMFVASGKAVANAIEHEHRDSAEWVIRLSATALVDQVRLTVADTGSWKPPQRAGDGSVAAVSP